MSAHERAMKIVRAAHRKSFVDPKDTVSLYLSSLEGWKLTPREIADGMSKAGADVLEDGGEWWRTFYAGEVWDAMWLAAPSPHDKEGDQ